jgi:endonuclease III
MVTYACARRVTNPLGIGVDVHVHRISNRLRVKKQNTLKKQESQGKELLPIEEWSSINHFVGFWSDFLCFPVRQCVKLVHFQNLSPHYAVVSPKKNQNQRQQENASPIK